MYFTHVKCEIEFLGYVWALRLRLSSPFQHQHERSRKGGKIAMRAFDSRLNSFFQVVEVRLQGGGDGEQELAVN